MGARKAIRAEKMKAEKKQKAIAVLRDCPTSPRRGDQQGTGYPPLLEERGVDPSGEAPQVGHRQLGGQERGRTSGRYQTLRKGDIC